MGVFILSSMYPTVITFIRVASVAYFLLHLKCVPLLSLCHLFQVNTQDKYFCQTELGCQIKSNNLKNKMKQK